jgi:hypothetical protein
LTPICVLERPRDNEVFLSSRRPGQGIAGLIAGFFSPDWPFSQTSSFPRLSSFSMLSITNQEVDVRGNVINYVSGDQYNLNIRVEGGSSSSVSRAPSSLTFNDAPLDLLSVHFTGREKELAHIGKVLDEVHGDIPTRCVVHGMQGLGKSQLTLQYAKMSFEKRRYSLIFWMSATSVEKLNQGFSNLLSLVGHTDRFHPEQSARLAAARRWLEESGSVNWLLVLDNVDSNALSFIRGHLPRKNERGNILCTTRTESVAKAVASVAGRRHEVFELGLPETEDATRLLI